MTPNLALTPHLKPNNPSRESHISDTPRRKPKGKLEAQAYVEPIFQTPKVRESDQNRPVLSVVKKNIEGNLS